MKLSRPALAYLKARGIDATAAAKRRLSVVDGAEAKALLGAARTFLVIPYFSADGAPLLNRHAPFVRGRDLTEAQGFDVLAAKNRPKFIQPAGTGNHIYLDPARKDWAARLDDPKVPLIITEGEVKAMCATDRGLPCLAFGGVWSWRTRVSGRSVPLPELDAIKWAGRDVELAFDSDVVEKPEVRAALAALAVELTTRGARVAQVVIPAAEDGGKVGLDDYLVANGAAEFAKLTRLYVALTLDPAAPYDAARAFVGARYIEAEGARTLHHHRGAFYRYGVARYVEVDPQALRGELYAFLDGAVQMTQNGKQPFKPSMKKVEDVLHALRAATNLDVGDPPVWLADDDGPDRPAPDDVIAAPNGLFDLRTRRIRPHSMAYFNLRAIDFPVDLAAGAPKRWLRFLADIWPKDAESIATLQEIVGYFLTTDARQQKIFALVGPPRSGKGTIAGVIQSVIGRDNVVCPSLGSLGERFGLQPLIGKSLAVIGDVRLGGRADQQALAERLLGISGQDGQTIDRKNREAWTGRLGVRILVMTNEVPRIVDASGALASRFVILRMTESFLGREDLGLAHALDKELPAIFLWALEGLDRLRKRGHFMQPSSAEEELRLLQDLGSPIKAFLRDVCDVGSEYEAPCDDLYKAWIRHCIENGRDHPGTAQSFARDLHAAVPGLKNVQRRVAGAPSGRQRRFVGVRLRPQSAAGGTR